MQLSLLTQALVCTWVLFFFSANAVFEITSDAIVSIDDVELKNKHILVQKTWSILQRQDSLFQFNEEALQELEISVPGRVFISSSWSSYDEPFATVKFSGSAPEVLEDFDVVSEETGKLSIRMKPVSLSQWLEGYLLVEITLSHSRQLQKLTSKGSGDIVVQEQVLFANTPRLSWLGQSLSPSSQGKTCINVSGSGTVYIDESESLDVKTLALSVSGSGNVQVVAPQVQVDEIDVRVSGSGSVSMLVDSSIRVSSSANIDTTGSGDVCVHTEEFTANSVDAFTAGSGDISIAASQGSCKKEGIVLLGSADILLGSLMCEEVTANLAGSGEVLVQATRFITGGCLGSGDIKYVGSPPDKIAPKTKIAFFHNNKDNKPPKPLAKAAKANKVRTCRRRPLPNREPVRITLNISPFGLPMRRKMMVPLVVVAVLAAWFVYRENKKRQSHHQRYQRELEPLQSTQRQVYI